MNIFELDGPTEPASSLGSPSGAGGRAVVVGRSGTGGKALRDAASANSWRIDFAPRTSPVSFSAAATPGNSGTGGRAVVVGRSGVGGKVKLDAVALAKIRRIAFAPSSSSARFLAAAASNIFLKWSSSSRIDIKLKRVLLRFRGVGEVEGADGEAVVSVVAQADGSLGRLPL